jgi:SecD/SecF fusion protein
MSRVQVWRIAVTAFFVLAALYYSWPTIEYWTLSDTERGSLQENDPAELFRMRQEAIRLGLDLQGGMHVVLRVQREKLDERARSDAVERALQIIRNRIDQFGVTEPLIQKQGEDRIIVDLPGFTDAQRAQRLIGETAQLQFKLMESLDNAELLLSKIDKVIVDTRGSEGEGETPAEGEAKSDTALTEEQTEPDTSNVDVLADLLGEAADTMESMSAPTEEELDQPFSINLELIPGTNFPMYYVETDLVPNVKAMLARPDVQKVIPNDVQFAWGRRSELVNSRYVTPLYILKSRVQMSGEYLVDATPATDRFGKPIVNFRLTREGGRIFSRVTGPNIGKPLAIVLDNKVESAPTINDRIRDQGTITMGSGAKFTEARDMSIVLKAGALPAPVEIIESNVVGPSLGQDSINKGLRSSWVALLLVLLFIAIYYRLSGVIADVALVFNLFFLLAAMAGLRATLTMPGIAGIILTIGISVDSNVLIFERIREELRTGKTVRAAIDAGYNRALLTIVDSHVTTLVTAAVLFIFGSGPIKGFAVTLFLGVSISLYTALIITKAIFDFRKGYKTLSI